jgi:3-oxo-5alpha-steroid 4-dehydrogenase
MNLRRDTLEHFDWLVRCGVPFKSSFWGEPGWEPPDDDGLMYTGGENAFPYNEIATPAPRGHVPQMQDKRTGEKGGGYMLMKPLVETATALSVHTVVDARVQRLVVESDGRVALVLHSCDRRHNMVSIGIYLLGISAQEES